jgi:hypothetical protein
MSIITRQSGGISVSENDETSDDPIERDDQDPDSDDESSDGDEDALTPELDADDLPVAISGP